MKLSSLVVSAKKEEQGVWVEIGEGAGVLVARMNNPKYRKRFSDLLLPHRQAIRNNLLSESVAQSIMTEVLAATVLLGWRGFADDDGNEIPYSYEKAKEVLGDPKFKDFRAMVEGYAEDAELFRDRAMAESAEVLKPTSGG